MNLLQSDPLDFVWGLARGRIASGRFALWSFLGRFLCRGGGSISQRGRRRALGRTKRFSPHRPHLLFVVFIIGWVLSPQKAYFQQNGAPLTPLVLIPPTRNNLKNPNENDGAERIKRVVIGYRLKEGWRTEEVITKRRARIPHHRLKICHECWEPIRNGQEYYSDRHWYGRGCATPWGRAWRGRVNYHIICERCYRGDPMSANGKLVKFYDKLGRRAWVAPFKQGGVRELTEEDGK